MRAQQIAGSLGAAFLEKPFDPADLFALIEELTEPLKTRAS
jgi:hypothetical protein